MRHFGLCLGVIVLCATSSVVWGLSVTPGRTEVRLSPGQKADSIITALNDSAAPVRVTLSTKDWFVLEANKVKELTVDKWLRVKGPKEFILKPGESRNVKIIATTPKNAEGELVSMVSFLYQGEQESMVN